MTRIFTAVYQPAEEGGYIAFVEEIPGANSQGETIDEARNNLREAVQLILQVNRELALKSVDETNAIREDLVIKS
ncbi:MAG TPA: type II toxin-antitoxin system HicB family antitoxin [Thermoanaerobaculia bacterium]|nr:type II toxin-antitoxin system HicB family antitoxin [Thermoanaerobaculia bacterium]